jgi:hypothetical protein
MDTKSDSSRPIATGDTFDIDGVISIGPVPSEFQPVNVSIAQYSGFIIKDDIY